MPDLPDAIDVLSITAFAHLEVELPLLLITQKLISNTHQGTALIMGSLLSILPGACTDSHHSRCACAMAGKHSEKRARTSSASSFRLMFHS